MAENEERQNQPGREGAPRGDEVDQTRAFDPLAEERPEGGPAERPGRGDAAERPGAGDTAERPGAGDTAEQPGGDEANRFGGPAETARFPSGAGADQTARSGAVPPDRTAAMPPTAPQPGEPAAWSGRARVPPPVPPPAETVPADWSAGEEPSGRKWWMPIVIGIVALLLLAILAYGLWLIANSRSEEVPVTPSPSPSAVPTAPTSAAPTTESPSPSPSPEEVEVPPVVDLPRPVAQALLDSVGLRYRIENRESDRPAGTVLEADPEPGETVPPGTEVTLVVAEPKKEPASPPTTQAPRPTPTG